MGNTGCIKKFLTTCHEDGIIAAIKGLGEYHHNLNPDNPIHPNLRAVLDLGVCTLRTVMLHPSVESRFPSLSAQVDRVTGDVLLSNVYVPAQNPQPIPTGT